MEADAAAVDGLVVANAVTVYLEERDGWDRRGPICAADVQADGLALRPIMPIRVVIVGNVRCLVVIL